MRNLIFALLIFLPFNTFSQKMNQKAIDEKRNNEMLIGYCDRNGFSSINCNFDSCFKSEYPAYKTDEATMLQLSKSLKGVKITIVLGTWCGDSKEWVPRFLKILDELHYKNKNLTLIAVDRTKSATGTNVNELKIDRVPTFIFFKKNHELGRIIETPEGILEKHILKIVSGK